MQNEDTSNFNLDGHWFEKFTWWRLTKKAPCLPEYIEIKNDDSIIDRKEISSLMMKIKNLKDECDYRDGIINNGPVQLQSKYI